jgi:hypothetical protein
MNLLTGNSKIAGDLCRLLGLPKNTRAFTLRVEEGQIATVWVTYYPEEPGSFGSPVSQMFKLVPLE